jgi:hypothetical protein
LTDITDNCYECGIRKATVEYEFEVKLKNDFLTIGLKSCDTCRHIVKDKATHNKHRIMPIRTISLKEIDKPEIIIFS